MSSLLPAQVPHGRFCPQARCKLGLHCAALRRTILRFGERAECRHGRGGDDAEVRVDVEGEGVIRSWYLHEELEVEGVTGRTVFSGGGEGSEG